VPIGPMTKEGGRYYRAVAFGLAITCLAIIPVLLMIAIGCVNPLWFRTAFLNWIIITTERITMWRNYKAYWIYLGMDPMVWCVLTTKSDK
jgi:glycerol-3-phosphate dehydrogenase